MAFFNSKISSKYHMVFTHPVSSGASQLAVSQGLLVFDDLDRFKQYRSGILEDVSLLEFAGA